MQSYALSVGLTGGIGSGKSEVARLLSARGAVVIDSDVLAREALAPGSPGLAEVVAAFGPEVLDGSAALDRAALGRAVFADPSRRALLEGIVHPVVRRRSAELAAAAPAGAVVVHDIPLLVENGMQGGFDVVVVVDSDDATRLARLTDVRGMTAEDARARMSAQATREQRLAVADEVVVNDGSLADLADAVDRLWLRLLSVPRRTVDR